MRRFLVVSLAAAVALSLGGPPASGTAAGAVQVDDNVFVPGTLTVSIGDTVTWTQTGVQPHTVTSDAMGPGGVRVFDSRPACTNLGFPQQLCMQQGDTYSYTFEQVGTFGYFCRVHGGPGGQGMSGAIQVVQGQPATAPPPKQDQGPEPGAPPSEDGSKDEGKKKKGKKKKGKKKKGKKKKGKKKKGKKKKGKKKKGKKKQAGARA